MTRQDVRHVRDIRKDTTVLSLPIDAAANELLRRSPLALLIGMVLDRQVSRGTERPF